MAGRPKGAPNKVTGRARELAAKMGVDPLEILLMFAKGDWQGLGFSNAFVEKMVASGKSYCEDRIPAELRCSAAKEAVKYIYPTQKSVDISSEDGSGIKIIVEDFCK